MTTAEQSYKSGERAVTMANLLLAEAEEQRREKPTLDSHPLQGENATVVDYGQSGSPMELAMAHLRESIPNGQKLRTEAAARALALVVGEQMKWLRQKGYRV